MGNEWEKMKKWQIEDIRRHLLLRFIIKEKSLIWCAKELPVPLSLKHDWYIFMDVWLVAFYADSQFKTGIKINFNSLNLLRKMCDIGQHTELPAEGEKNWFIQQLKLSWVLPSR